MTSLEQTPASPAAIRDSYSPWAALSLVLVLVSFGGCLVTMAATYFISPMVGLAMFAMPVVALLAVVTGAIGLSQIRRSGGAMGGRNAAMVGVIVGLGLTALQSSVVLGALIPFFSIGNNVTPAAQGFADALAQGDSVSARAYLSDSASDVLSDDALASFWASASPGGDGAAVPEASFDFGLIANVREAMAGAARAESGTTINEQMFPVRYTWADGSVSVVYFFLDQEAMGRNEVRVVDVLVVDASGAAAVLLPDGPARFTAESVGWELPKGGG